MATTTKGLYALFGTVGAVVEVGSILAAVVLTLLVRGRGAAFYPSLAGALGRGLGLENCGCFGVFLARPLEWYTPLEDAVLIAASYGLFYLSDGARRGAIPVAAEGFAEAGAPGAEARG